MALYIVVVGFFRREWRAVSIDEYWSHRRAQPAASLLSFTNIGQCCSHEALFLPLSSFALGLCRWYIGFPYKVMS